MRHTVEILQSSNAELKTEIEAFKLFTKGLVKQNKTLKDQVQSLPYLQSQVKFYKDYSVFMERECTKLKVQNY